MTGQVKEDILCRIGELGVIIKERSLCFYPSLLARDEFLKNQSSFEYYDVSGKLQKITIDPDSLAFTFCQTPIVYKHANTASIFVRFVNDNTNQIEGNQLPAEITKKLFNRSGEIAFIEVNLPP